MKKQLDAEQKKVVNFPQQPLLVCAGAGAGKTETMVQRIVHQITNGIEPKRICLLTFTNKASQAMISRASGHIDASTIVAGTFHGFAYRMLREVGFERGFYFGQKILTDFQASRMFEQSLKETYDKEARKVCRDNRISIAGSLRKIYTGITVSNKKIEDFPIVTNLNSIVPCGVDKFFELYKLKKFEAKAFDFEDILIQFRRMLQIPDIQKMVSARFDAYFIDEAQDLFPIQFDIVKLLVGGSQNLTVVGDSLQSIYGFLGSEPKMMFKFLTDFKCTRIDLSRNYRSTAEIVALANEISTQSRETLPFKMHSASRVHGDTPLFMKSHSPSIEAKLIVQQITDLIAGGTKPEEIAVLTRLSATTAVLELELHRKKVEFLKVGGSDVLRKDNIRGFMALIEILLNRYDYSAWDIVLPLVPYIGTKTAAVVIDDMSKITDWTYKTLPPLTVGNGKRWNELQKLFISIGELDDKITAGLTSREIVDAAFSVFSAVYTAYWFTLEEKAQQKLMDDVDVTEVTTYTTDKNLNKKLQEVYNYIVVLTHERDEDLRSLLGGIAVSSIGSDETSKAGKITVSTIHSAKGLEWEYVYVVGAEYGTLPPKDRVETAVDKDSADIGLVNLTERTNYQEELRLFYVACTRAKKSLTVSYTNERFDLGLNPSIFIEPYILRTESCNKIEQLELSRWVNYGG